MPALRRYTWLLLPLVTSFITACATIPRDIDPPRIHIANITPKDVTLFEQRYDVQLRIMNPNDSDLGIKGMRFDIELQELSKSDTGRIRYRLRGTALVESPSTFKLPFDEKGEIDFTPAGER